MQVWKVWNQFSLFIYNYVLQCKVYVDITSGKLTTRIIQNKAKIYNFLSTESYRNCFYSFDWHSNNADYSIQFLFDWWKIFLLKHFPLTGAVNRNSTKLKLITPTTYIISYSSEYLKIFERFISTQRSSFSMSKAKFLSVLWILLSLHKNVMTLQTEALCDEIDITKFIEFQYDHKCLQVIVQDNSQSTCAIKLFGLNGISLKIRSFATVKNRDISSEVQDYCQTFLIFADGINDAVNIIQSDQVDRKRFFPFTKIYFHFSDTLHDTDMSSKKTLLKILLTRNALFGYIFEFTNERIGSPIVIRDILTDDLKRSTVSYTPSDLFHPIVDTRLEKDDFRISLFNCKPFIFYPEDASDETYINSESKDCFIIH